LFTLKEGDRVTVSGPYGKFLLPDPLTLEPVFFARYTGIVPIRCMLKHLAAVAHSGPITLSYSAPSQSELVYRDDFIVLASSHPHFRYIETVAQPNDHAKPVQEWSEFCPLLPHLEKRTDFVPMISGVKAFVHPLRAYFIERGFGRREVRVETYD
jgi:phenol hydroxylase P5 protein